MTAADKHIPFYVRLFIASVAGTGVSFVIHPTDLIKNRMQMINRKSTLEEYKSTINAFNTIIKNDGILALYTGFYASLVRQMAVTTTRVGVYSVLTDTFTEEDGTPPSIVLQFFSGFLSGALGGIVGNPSDVVLVRMTVDGILPEKERHNYKNPFSAVRNLYIEEKLYGLWLGGRAATIRCMILNVTQVVFYKNVKASLLNSEQFEDDVFLHLLCGSLTAMVSSASTLPLDVVKTRMMSKPATNASARLGIIKSWKNIINSEGLLALWRGFTPTIMRNLPNNIVIFLILESMTKYYKKIFLGDQSNSGF